MACGGWGYQLATQHPTGNASKKEAKATTKQNPTARFGDNEENAYTLKDLPLYSDRECCCKMQRRKQNGFNM
jgi:hypothetical protein